MTPPFRYLDDPAELPAVVEAASACDRYAIDTEFHRERTYFPKVALLQLAYDAEVVLIDPLEVPLDGLVPLLEGDGLCVMHAASQDLEVLQLAAGTVPARLFDTQIAAGFLGYSTASLATLMQAFLGADLPKANRLTDWLRRPLSDAQLRYAAADVDRLLELAGEIERELATLGRTEWAEVESEALRANPPTRREPEEAIHRIREARSLKGSHRRVATEIAAWRERRAARLDVPVRQVLADLAVAAVAQRGPDHVDQLDGIRGLETRRLGKEAARELVDAVSTGKERPEPPRESESTSVELPRELRPVVGLITAWVAQHCRDHKLDPAMLATRADIEALLAADSGRLTEGWRAEMAGDAIRGLVSGGAALAFDEGRLVLEKRSGEPI